MEKRGTILVDPDLHKKVKELAVRKGLTLGALADEYLAAGVAKEEKRKARVA
jgi:predicted transcriptional regulator